MTGNVPFASLCCLHFGKGIGHMGGGGASGTVPFSSPCCMHFGNGIGHNNGWWRRVWYRTLFYPCCMH